MKKVIRKLRKLIYNEAPQEEISVLEELLADSIEDVVDNEKFYKIPTENLLIIIEKSKTTDIKIIKKLVYNFNVYKEEEAPLILNVVDTGDANLDEYIEVLTTLSTCPICKRIGKIIEDNKNIPKPDYKGEIKILKQKVVELEKEIAKMKSGGNSTTVVDIKKFKNVVGIDFGLTKTCVCHYEPSSREKYIVFENKFGQYSTPNYVQFRTDGMITIGEEAKKCRYLDPENTVYDIQRLIGKKKGDKSIDEFFGKAPFKIVYHGNDPFIHIDGDSDGRKEKDYSPEEISAFILSETKEVVKTKTGSYPDACVITVPAYFSESQRDATKNAADIAGLNCIKIISEPTAAILAHRESYSLEEGKVLVFDFGGKELDVTILEVKGDQIKVLACECNQKIGGEHIDSILCDEMIKRFVKKNPGCDPTKDPKSMALLRSRCKEAKEILSISRETKITIPNFFKGMDLDESITKSIFSYICEDPIISKLEEQIDAAFESAGIETEEIDHIIPVGGCSQIHFVSESLGDYFEDRLEPIHCFQEGKICAIGAAAYFNKTITEVME